MVFPYMGLSENRVRQIQGFLEHFITSYSLLNLHQMELNISISRQKRQYQMKLARDFHQ